MGWSYLSGEEFSVSDFMKDEFPTIKSWAFIHKGVIGGEYHEIYGIAPDHSTNGKTAVVILVDEVNALEYGWKYFSEAEEPFYYNCPVKLLDKLSPVEILYPAKKMAESAQKWRDKCYRTAQKV